MFFALRLFGQKFDPVALGLRRVPQLVESAGRGKPSRANIRANRRGHVSPIYEQAE